MTMLIVIGTIYATPATLRGINRVRAASGPEAARLNASSPKTGIPPAAPSLSEPSSEERRGRPKRASITDIVRVYLPMSGLSLHGKRDENGPASPVALNCAQPPEASFRLSVRG